MRNESVILKPSYTIPLQTHGALDFKVMHDIQPYYKWRDFYIASEDKMSPFYGRRYNEFAYHQKIYNYYIHPLWDSIGSPTLFVKVLFVSYAGAYAIIELLGEWNDCISNDAMFLKRELADKLIDCGIHKFILLCDNVLNFHGDDDSYYEEWSEEVTDHDGYICLINLQSHVEREMRKYRLHRYLLTSEDLSDMDWFRYNPKDLFRKIEELIP